MATYTHVYGEFGDLYVVFSFTVTILICLVIYVCYLKNSIHFNVDLIYSRSLKQVSLSKSRHSCSLSQVQGTTVPSST